MAPINISINEDMTKFMIRNILGHEPCHDFNPAGAGSRYVKLNKQLENVKIDGIYQEGGSGKYDGTKVSATNDSVFSFDDGNGNDDVTINIYADMKDEPPSTVFNRIAINEKKEDEKEEDEKKEDEKKEDEKKEYEKEEDRSILAPNVDEDGLIDDDSNSISNVFYSILGNDYKSFLKEFDVDADNMNNSLQLNAPDTDTTVTRSMTQIRSNTINGIQSITEMTDYIRMYMFNYIAGYKSASNDVAGLKSSGRKGGRMNKPNELMIKEEIEENNDNALMSIENKKKKNDIATTIQEGESDLKQGIQEGESDLKQGIQEGESDLKQGIQEDEEAAQATVAKEEAVASTVEVAEAAKAAEAEASIAEASEAASIAEASEAASTAEAAATEEAASTEEAAETTLLDRYQEYSYLNNALTYIIKEFDDYDKLDDDALIDVMSIDTDISRPCLKETKNIFVFYQYIFNYYINNINNILSSYLVNDSYFIRDAIFFFFINHFNSNEEKFLEITDEEKKRGILNEIFNLRIPEWSDDNKYLASIKKNKKEEIVEKQIKEENIDIKKLPGQKGGDDDDDDEAILSLQIINMTTGLGPVTPVFNDSPKTVTIGTTSITTQDQLISALQEVYGSLISDLMTKISDEGNNKYAVPDKFDETIQALQGQLIGEFVTNPKSTINQLKPKKGMGSLFTSIKKYITPPTPGATVPRGSDPRNLKNSINNAINTITTNLKARIIRLVSVVMYNKIKIQGAKTSSLSREAQVPVNMILQTVCQKVNDIIGIPPSYRSPSENNSAAQTNALAGEVFLTQKHIIDKIATGGSTSDVDTKLYDGFKNWLNNNLGINKEVYGNVPSWNPTSLKEFIQNKGTQPVKVINNALSDKSGPYFAKEKMIKVLSDYKTSSGINIFQIKCPISSIFDAQGSFGSCNFGLNTRKSKNVNGKPVSSNRHNAEVITDNMFIEINGSNGFSITVNLTFKPKPGTYTGRAILIYTITPGQNYKENNGNYKTITGKIDSVIRDEAIDILSAKTVFSDVFNNITAKLGNGSLTEYLTGATAIYEIMSGLTQKFMGDFAPHGMRMSKEDFLFEYNLPEGKIEEE